MYRREIEDAKKGKWTEVDIGRKKVGTDFFVIEKGVGKKKIL